ncbi:MAG: tRNA lysidine(34) synthetase TilS [Clostridium sp.]
MQETVLHTIKKYNMIENGDNVLVALSGGPDSMAMLHVLYSLKDALGINIVGAAHLNHLLRGEDAECDQQICEKFCKEINVPFYCRRIDIDSMAKENGVSHEMAGREARYNFFDELVKSKGYTKVAIAHNLNDQAETVLMRMMRGSGIEGLVGIKPVRDEVFIRPIIEVSRNIIEGYCDENKLNPAIDKTNFENVYSRNKVRLELIPYIEENFNQDIIKTLNRMSRVISEDNDFIEGFSKKIFEKYCYKKGDRVIIYKDAFNEHKAVVSRVLRMAIMQVKGSLYNIESGHINDIIKLYNHNTGKTLMLPGNLRVDNVYKDIYVYIYEEKNKADKEFSLKLSINDSVYCEELSKTIKLTTISNDGNFKIKSKDMIKYFDFDKIKGDISVRYRKNGDKFSALGMKGSKKIKDIFMDLKIPREERDFIPLICFGDEIAWIVGFRVSEKFKIDRNTKKILQVSIER